MSELSPKREMFIAHSMRAHFIAFRPPLDRSEKVDLPSWGVRHTFRTKVRPDIEVAVFAPRQLFGMNEANRDSEFADYASELALTLGDIALHPINIELKTGEK